jgi:hypothetical protein
MNPTFVMMSIAVALSSLITYYLIQLSEERLYHVLHQEIETASTELRETFVNNLKAKLYGAMGLFRNGGEESSSTATEENHFEYGNASRVDGHSD